MRRIQVVSARQRLRLPIPTAGGVGVCRLPMSSRWRGGGRLALVREIIEHTRVSPIREHGLSLRGMRVFASKRVIEQLLPELLPRSLSGSLIRESGRGGWSSLTVDEVDAPQYSSEQLAARLKGEAGLALERFLANDQPSPRVSVISTVFSHLGERIIPYSPKDRKKELRAAFEAVADHRDRYRDLLMRERNLVQYFGWFWMVVCRPG